MLLDSNIIIYSCRMHNEKLRILVNDHQTCCSAISQIETLGYHKISESEKCYLQRFFDTVTVYAISQKDFDWIEGLKVVDPLVGL